MRNFQCLECGKRYGSAAATHTHIDTKHKQYKDKNKKKIIKNLNPTVNAGTENNHVGIRMKDIDFPKIEAGCMEIADLALYHIYGHAKTINKKDILISEEDSNFYEDIESENEENDNKMNDETIREVIKKEPKNNSREDTIKKLV